MFASANAAGGKGKKKRGGDMDDMDDPDMADPAGGARAGRGGAGKQLGPGRHGEACRRAGFRCRCLMGQGWRLCWRATLGAMRYHR